MRGIWILNNVFQISYYYTLSLLGIHRHRSFTPLCCSCHQLSQQDIINKFFFMVPAGSYKFLSKLLYGFRDTKFINDVFPCVNTIPSLLSVSILLCFVGNLFNCLRMISNDHFSGPHVKVTPETMYCSYLK